MLNSVLQILEARRSTSLEQLKTFLAIPSVSAKPDHAAAVRECANWLSNEFEKTGLKSAVRQTAGHPVVVARNNHVAGRPTVLLYGHYDVQPPEPLDLWTTPAFVPTVRKDENGFDAIYARGAVDDKGQVWAHVEAIAAWQAAGGLPVNITVLIEGEEEVGSENLAAFVRSNREELKADVCVISDTGLFNRDTPAIDYGLRGLVYEEVVVTGPSHDLHSGQYGGAVPNPANVLCQLMASLHNADGRVNIPGFYDDVQTVSQAEKDQWKRLNHDEAAVAKSLDLPFLSGEAGHSALERTWSRPTCDINGMTAGYQGPGAKTVIASKASAKVSMRLVPNQNPATVQAIFRKTILDRAPKNVKIDFIINDHNADPVVVAIDNPATTLAAEAVKLGFGKEPVFIRGGGTIPVVGLLTRELGLACLLIGFGLPDDRVHSPNEKFDLDCFYKGQKTAAALYDKLSKLAV